MKPMHRTVIALICTVALASLVAIAPVRLNAQGASSSSTAVSTPDFSGVYYPAQQGRGGDGAAATPAGGQRGTPPPAGQRATPPPPPTRSAPTSDLSNGRSPTAPLLTPEYMAKWEIIRKSRISGSYEYDPIANCLPPGLPHMLSMPNGIDRKSVV